jgi:hypothetical protein
MSNQEEIYWIFGDRTQRLMSQLTPDELQNALIVCQKRQILSYNSIENATKLIESIKKEEKKRKLSLMGLETTESRMINSYIRNKFIENKKALDSIFRIIKLKLNKDGKRTEVILQDTNEK